MLSQSLHYAFSWDFPIAKGLAYTVSKEKKSERSEKWENWIVNDKSKTNRRQILRDQGIAKV